MRNSTSDSLAGESSVPWNSSTYGAISNSPNAQDKDFPTVQFPKKNGLGVLAAAIFIAGEMAGSGILALPRAVVDCGWIGLVLIVILCINSCYGGSRLGRCWEIIEERYPQFRGSTRNPYPTIAEKAVGRWGRNLVSACIQITLFGVGVVNLLLASQILQELLKPLLPKVTFCTWFLLFALMITPPMWLGSPKDFLWVGIGAILATIVSCTLIIIQLVTEGIEQVSFPEHIPHGFKDFFISFGIILFTFGGSSTFPTIQNDMIDRTKFTKSLLISFTEFCWLRCIVRTGMVLLMVVVGETVPQFSKILSLVGGSTITLLTFVLPNYFYMRLCDQESIEWPKREIALHKRTYMWELILIGIFGGAASTYSAILSILGSDSFTKPCYWI